MTKDNRLKILQVGSSNWSENQEIPEMVLLQSWSA